MKNREKIEQLLSTSAFLFGNGEDLERVYFKVSAYLNLVEKYGTNSKISEFKLITELEEIDSYFSVKEMRKFVNELRILNRDEEGSVSIKETIHLDDYSPGDAPNEIGAIPTDFYKFLEVENSEFDASNQLAEETLRKFSISFLNILAAAHNSPLDFVTPFYRPSLGDSDGGFEYTGTSAASTPFLDLYLARKELGALFYPNESKKNFDEQTNFFFKSYLDNIILTRIGDREYSTFFLRDDEDLPGSQLPSTISNASLISALVSFLEEADNKEEIQDTISNLVEFILVQQNDDGGWPTFRYLNRDGNLETESDSIGLVSLVCFASLLDAYDLLSDGKIKASIEVAASKYGNWLSDTSVKIDDNVVAWENSSRNLCVFESAMSALGCHLADILSPSDDLKSLINSTVCYIQRNWKFSSEPALALHKITLRAPELNRLSLLPIDWLSPGDSRIARTLCMLSIKRRIQLKFSTVLEIAKTISDICNRCNQGYATRIVDPDVLEVSTTKHHAIALGWYLQYIKEWESIDPK